MQVFAGWALCLRFSMITDIAEDSAFARPSEDQWALASPLASDTTETWPQGPSHTQDSQPESPSSHVELSEGRIPRAPKFTATFILSKTRGDTPRSEGLQQNKLQNNQKF